MLHALVEKEFEVVSGASIVSIDHDAVAMKKIFLFEHLLHIDAVFDASIDEGFEEVDRKPTIDSIHDAVATQTIFVLEHLKSRPCWSIHLMRSANE